MGIVINGEGVERTDWVLVDDRLGFRLCGGHVDWSTGEKAT